MKKIYIKIYCKETGYGGLHWIHLAQDNVQWWALMNTEMKLAGSIKDGEFLY
jgi:hypothetical protein